ncbi:MAG TPA: DUF368 domain-containing protein [Bacilli bacterium]|nr:DUF368 domain-containing protein [Bacilli bacterium]
MSFKESIKNFFIGVIAGIGNITPGLSGSALLIIFGVYENCIKAISKIFKNFKKSIFYLMPIGIGLVAGTIGFSNVIKICIERYEVITMIVFMFFIIGTLPTLFKKANKNKFKITYLIPLVITFSLGIVLLIADVSTNQEIITTLNTQNFIILFLTGMLVAASSIIPGISSTVLLTMLGLYTTYLTAIAELNVIILIPVVLGFGIGAFVLAKLIDKLMEKFYSYTFYGILGFVLATIPALIPKNLALDSNLLIGIVLGSLAFLLTVLVEKRAKS